MKSNFDSRAGSVWPADELETLAACPLCGAKGRHIIHKDLRDNTFFVAPGPWTLWRCDACDCGYLDPRPTRASIHRAYARYYTHDAPFESPPPRTWLQKIRTSLANGYRNRRYGARLAPSASIGFYIARLVPPLARPSDIQYRFLRLSERTDEKRCLLDVGCGAGRFLTDAREAGWEVTGVDFDPVAVDNARKRGLDVHLGGLEQFAHEHDIFDAITMSHVIEHMHDPREAVARVFELLKPGGAAYIETPNLDSLGHELYQSNWRGLEPPRHLVLFNASNLQRTFAEAGYEKIRFWHPLPQLGGIGLLSARIAAGRDPHDHSDESVRGPSLWNRMRSAVSIRRNEFLVITARKPS